jgi:hypothetical protein
MKEKEGIANVCTGQRAHVCVCVYGGRTVEWKGSCSLLPFPFLAFPVCCSADRPPRLARKWERAIRYKVHVVRSIRATQLMNDLSSHNGLLCCIQRGVKFDVSVVAVMVVVNVRRSNTLPFFLLLCTFQGKRRKERNRVLPRTHTHTHRARKKRL